MQSTVLMNIDMIYEGSIKYISIFILYLFIFFSIKNYLNKNHNKVIEDTSIQIQYNIFVKYNKVMNMTFFSDLEITLNQVILHIKNINYYFDIFLFILSIIICICILTIKFFSIQNLLTLIFTPITYLYIIISFIICIIELYNISTMTIPLEKESISSHSLFSNLFNNAISIIYNKGLNFSKEEMKKSYIFKKEESIINNNNIFFMPLLFHISYYITIIMSFITIKFISQFLDSQNNKFFFEFVDLCDVLVNEHWFFLIFITIFIGLPIFINHILLNCMNYYLLQIFIISNRFEYLKYPLYGTTYDIKTIKNISFKNCECFFMD